MTGFAASLPLEAQPGTKFNYSSGTANILSKLYMESFNSRGEAFTYAQKKLFEPLGIASATLEADASGILLALLTSMQMRATGFISHDFFLTMEGLATNNCCRPIS